MRLPCRGDVEAVRALIPLQKRKQTSREVNVNGWITLKGTVLTVAATRRHVECVKLPMKREVGMRDDFGEAALMYAAQWGHREAVEILIKEEKGIRDNEGNTVLIYANKGGYLEIAETIKAHGDFDDFSLHVPEDNWDGAYCARSVLSRPHCIHSWECAYSDATQFSTLSKGTVLKSVPSSMDSVSTFLSADSRSRLIPPLPRWQLVHKTGPSAEEESLFSDIGMYIECALYCD
ncbi:Ankyrin repeat protein [Giardia duodenalis]|uniref:Ankyrin repeat protein n=1 Tax=Giardia intestinalis TaxID=5741 RepID=V6TXR6_GIAIN|nr:Ankyrin repeat protein [Giardia intestinalis]